QQRAKRLCRSCVHYGGGFMCLAAQHHTSENSVLWVVIACSLSATGVVACSPEPTTRVAAAVHDGDPALLGHLGPAIPFHKAGIPAWLVWDHPTAPGMCFAMRLTEWRGTDLVDPTIGPLCTMRPEFERLVYGGFPFSMTLDHSVRTRIIADVHRENV